MPLRTGSSSLTSVEPNAPLQYASQTASQAEVISISYSAHRSGVPGVRIENSKPFAALSYHKRGKPVRPNWLATDPVLLLCSI
jgi:hypothetical protein